MKLSNKAYDIIKLITITILPALGTLYFALSQIWGLPAGEEVVGSVAALTTFLGAIVKTSSDNYRKENKDA